MILSWTIFIIFGTLATVWTFSSIYELIMESNNINAASVKMWIISMLLILITATSAQYIFG